MEWAECQATSVIGLFVTIFNTPPQTASSHVNNNDSNIKIA